MDTLSPNESFLFEIKGIKPRGTRPNASPISIILAGTVRYGWEPWTHVDLEDSLTPPQPTPAAGGLGRGGVLNVTRSVHLSLRWSSGSRSFGAPSVRTSTFCCRRSLPIGRRRQPG